MATSKHTASRRSFLAGVGAAAGAAVAAPLAALGAESKGAQDHLEQFRACYRREIEKLAERLRPRFEAGELRANREEDFTESWHVTVDTDALPAGLIGAAVEEFFGLRVTRGGDDEDDVGDHAAAFTVLVASPSTMAVADSWTHPCYWAREAATLDVIRFARARQWYEPTPDEEYQEATL